jgi:hypothetical protein
MQGLELAEAYFSACGLPMILDRFAPIADRVAAGMVGPGSECHGFDDELSLDHDWGPGFCLWLNAVDYEVFGAQLQEAYRHLPAMFQGMGPRRVSPGEEHRVGVSSITAFYARYTGLEHYPRELRDWLPLPEQALSLCTNGKVFYDPSGTFSAWRQHLLGYYPEDIRLKKIASRCLTMAQSGQYNFARCLKRGETFAAHYAKTQFCNELMAMTFLLNRRFPPFYKWIHRATRDLPILGLAVHERITRLLETTEVRRKTNLIEELCAVVIDELHRQELSDADSDFLLDHGPVVNEKIRDPQLKNIFAIMR